MNPHHAKTPTIPPLLPLILLISLQISPSKPGFACLSNPCIHGICLDDLNSTYFCYCIDGYTGIECQTNWNECWSSPCQNGGICIDGIAAFNCSCPPGFLGDLCEEDFNECESNPCLNNGTCLDAPNGYSCNCLVGYSGYHCEVDVAVCNITEEARCSNGGVCQEGPGESFSCRCPQGWGGFLCDSELDECRSAPCLNGAVCIDFHADYSCACVFGFSGKNCEESVQVCDESPCKNGALCLMEENRATCYCVPDFHGDLCQYQYDECQLGPRCLNGGTCIDGVDNFTCSCLPKLTGVQCECLILEDGTLDCNYVGTTVVPTTFETTTVPNVTMTELQSTSSYIYRSSTDDFWSTSGTYTSDSTTSQFTLPFTTIETTIPPTDVTISISTTESSTETTSSTQITSSSTEFISSTTSEWSTSTNIPIISTEIPSSTSGTTTTEEVTSSTTEIISTTELIDTSTTIFTTEFSTSTTLVPLTELETTPISSSTTIEERESNRTLDIETTTFIISTIFTEEPLSTTSESSTTTVPPNDCSVQDAQCQNGGTCILKSDHTHVCVCPFDTEGTFCEVRLGVRNAAFTGTSYLSHRLLNYSKIEFDFEAKTLADDGLIFFANIDTSYMALYIENGFLKFKFSCGYQTMLLSELKVPVNNGYSMLISAILEFSKDFKKCDALVKLNSTLTMMGDQTARVDKFSTPLAWLHLGGIPHEQHYLPKGGFTGCLSNLKISGRKMHIFADAEDGHQITECSSLACLANPCRNGAACISSGDDWKCKCKNGFLGKMCERSVCENNPCLFGGTCIPFSGSGYLCLCPYGKHGHFCENDMKISEPYFSSTVRGLSSFVAYPIPDGISRNMEIRFRFTPTSMEQIALLLFIGQNGYHDFYSDHLAVSFVKGFIMLTWNLGSGPRRIFTTQPIKKGARDYLVRLGHFGRRAWLYVENLGNVTGRTPGNLAHLDVVPLLYLGGHFSQNFSVLPHDLPLHTGFSGCIFDVEIKSGSIAIPLQGGRQTIGRAVGQCGTTECYEQSCQNSGACLHHGSTFMCLCQDSWYGPLCASRSNICDNFSTKCAQGSTCVPLLSTYECDCAFGKVGNFCEKGEKITDVSFTGRRSYITLASQEIDNTRFNIEMEARILNDHGVLLYIGKSSTSFICLSLENGMLELRVQNEQSKTGGKMGLTVRSTNILVKGVWHKIQLGVFGRKVFISVDNVISTGLLRSGNFVAISRERIFLGGLPDLSRLPAGATPSLPVPFTGCLRQLSVDAKHLPLTGGNVLEGRNIVDCDGTPCGSDACLNGGTCWLDAFMNPHCNCVQPYFGEQCEQVPGCDGGTTCHNSGTCVDRACFCKVGYKGAFCETEILVKTPQFTGLSYLVFNNLKNGTTNKKRDLQKIVLLSNIYLNFTTAKPNGLLVWSGDSQNFLAIGIDRKFVKLILKTPGKLVEVPSYIQVADGLWHTIEMKFSGGKFELRLDGKYLENKLIGGISTNGVFYIGGIPASNGSSLLKATQGWFGEAFEGCIEGFGANDVEVVRDFSGVEGGNVNVCHMG